MLGGDTRPEMWRSTIPWEGGFEIRDEKPRERDSMISLKNALSWFCLGTTFVCYNYWQGHSISLKLTERLQNRFISISNKPGIPPPFKKKWNMLPQVDFDGWFDIGQPSFQHVCLSKHSTGLYSFTLCSWLCVFKWKSPSALDWVLGKYRVREFRVLPDKVRLESSSGAEDRIRWGLLWVRSRDSKLKCLLSWCIFSNRLFVMWWGCINQ